MRDIAVGARLVQNHVHAGETAIVLARETIAKRDFFRVRLESGPHAEEEWYAASRYVVAAAREPH